jgi:hypothetical protein
VYAPILIFAYNRPQHLKATLQCLEQNDLASQSILYVYADGPKKDSTAENEIKINKVREVLNEKFNFKEVDIIARDCNMGLANNVIAGVTEIVNQYGSVIVLEDDLLTSKGFLTYMNNALEKYKSEDKVMQISGHQFPVSDINSRNESFFLPFTTSWGWATWRRAWSQFDESALGYESLKTNNNLKDKFNLDNTYPYSSMLINQMENKSVDSWAIRWWWSVFKKDGLVLFPDKSLVKNVGFDANGTHTKGQDPFEIINFNHNYFIQYFPTLIAVNDKAYNYIKSFISKRVKILSNVSNDKLTTRLKRIINAFINLFRK